MRRDPVGKLILSLGLVILAGLAGVTRFPDAPLVIRVSEWPVAGPWIERLANLYRHDAPLESRVRARDITGDQIEVVYDIDIEQYEARPRVWATPGNVFFREPSQSAKRLAVVGSYTNLLLFERRGDWYRVRYGDEKGWIHLPGYQESTEPPLGGEPDRVVPVPSAPPDAEVLSLALTKLDRAAGPGAAGALGPYALYTDVEDDELLAFLSRVAEQVEPAYEKRYGVVPLAGAREAIVLFRSQERYLSYQRTVPGIADVAAPGVVHEGVVATYSEGREPAEIASTVLHELTHLLNRRAVGPALPPWLEEGLADDMGQSHIDESGRLTAGRLGGYFRRSAKNLVWSGGRASAIELARTLDSGNLLSVEALVELDWSEFQEDGERTLRYSQSSFFIRSLLDSPDAELAKRFRLFLADTASGQPLTPERLRKRLGRSWSSLDARLASFVRLQVIDEGVPSRASGTPSAGESSSSSRQANEPSE